MLRTKAPPRPKREREPGEFAGFTPKARTAVAPGMVAQVAALEREPRREVPRVSAREREHMGRVAALGCIVCRLLGYGPTAAQVHHVRAGQGKAQRSGNFCTVPLCEPHHTGPRGVHGDRACLRQLNMDEMDLLDIVIGELAA